MRVTFIHADGKARTEAEAEPGSILLDVAQAHMMPLEGTILLDVAQAHMMPLEGTCEGQMACSTCHVIVAKEDFDRLPPASEMEEDMLDLAAGVRRTSRLSCQIVLTDDLDGLTVHIPAESRNMQGPR
jgi:ferredoxin